MLKESKSFEAAAAEKNVFLTPLERLGEKEETGRDKETKEEEKERGLSARRVGAPASGARRRAEEQKRGRARERGGNRGEPEEETLPVV